MKISKLSISNYIGAVNAEIKINSPVTLICGSNDAGKSSISEAVRHALTGLSTRTSKKNELKDLVSDGAEAGFAFIEYDGGKKAAITLPNGVHELEEQLPGSLPYVLDAQKFSELSENDKRSFLFGLMGIKVDHNSIAQRMIDKGCDPTKIERIKPILRSGFGAGKEEAGNKAREAKGSWKTATGGQTWGKDKAEKWAPDPLQMTEDEATEALQKSELEIKRLDELIISESEKLGAHTANEEQTKLNDSQKEELAQKAEKLDRIKAKLEIDKNELADWEEKIAVIKSNIQATKIPENPLLTEFHAVAVEMLSVVDSTTGVLDKDTGEIVEWSEYDILINRMRGHLDAYSAEQPNKESLEEEKRLPEYEKSLTVLRNSVTNGERDLTLAEEAKGQLAAIESKDEQSEETVDIEGLKEKIAKLTEERDFCRSEANKYKELYTQAASREKLITTVNELHSDILEWLKISDALSPDGIQKDLLSDALTPLNDRLKQSAEYAEWDLVSISNDMQILSSDGKTQQPYHLLSESGKWRAEAMIAEAISYISGIKMLFLDRFDVLDMENRGNFVYWLDELAANGDIETCFVFGTLKAIPNGLPETITPYWMEDGVLANKQSNRRAA